MKLTLTLSLGMALSATPAQVPRVTIEHEPVACAVAERFPRLVARFVPVEDVVRARVIFQGQNVSEWYSVDMKVEGPGFAGVLPKPKKSLKAFRYYLEAVDRKLGTSRTEEHTTAVIDSPGGCKGKTTAGALASASIVLQGPAEGAALPAGFASSGVVSAAAGSAAGASSAVAAGGGIGATALVLGGVAVAGGAVAVASGKGTEGTSASGSSNTAAPTLAPTPAPTPSPTPGSEFAGHWSGTMQWLRTNPGSSDCSLTLDVSFDLTQSGSAVGGTLAWVTRVASPPTCGSAGQSGAGPVSGSASGPAITMKWDPAGQPATFTLTGTLTGRTINGTLTGAATDNVPEKFTGTFTVSH